MKRFDFKSLLKRLSTWVAALGTAGGSILTWYVAQPPAVQQTVPAWLLTAASIASLITLVGVPMATSFRQRYK